MQEAEPKVEISAVDVTVKNAALLEAQAKRVLFGSVQVTTALTIPRPAGSAIVSLTTIRTTPTSTATSCSIAGEEELLQALRATEQRNAQLPHEISKPFAHAVKPLLEVDRGEAQQGLRPNFGAGKSLRLPLPMQGSLAGTSNDCSGAAYVSAPSRVAEENAPKGID